VHDRLVSAKDKRMNGSQKVHCNQQRKPSSYRRVVAVGQQVLLAHMLSFPTNVSRRTSEGTKSALPPHCQELVALSSWVMKITSPLFRNRCCASQPALQSNTSAVKCSAGVIIRRCRVNLHASVYYTVDSLHYCVTNCVPFVTCSSSCFAYVRL
jgi:hypothetical protein